MPYKTDPEKLIYPVGNRHACVGRICSRRTHVGAAFHINASGLSMSATNTFGDSKTVFLVDDDSSTVSLYSDRLEQAGFRTASAVDAVEASEALANLSADLIILDLMLPKLGGFELLKAIRSDSRHKDTPVLVLFNAYLPEMAQKALRAGGNKALLKSECTSSELISVSRDLVGISEAGPVDQPAAVYVSGANSPEAGVATADLAEQLK